MSASDRQAPAHAPMTQFPSRDGELLVGGLPITRLTARVGSTPFYVYDRTVIAARINALRAALPENIKIHYAMKANPMPALVAYMAGRVDGIDVASGGELKVALDAGANPNEISFAGPGKSTSDLRRAAAAGCASRRRDARSSRSIRICSRCAPTPSRSFASSQANCAADSPSDAHPGGCGVRGWVEGHRWYTAQK